MRAVQKLQLITLGQNWPGPEQPVGKGKNAVNHSVAWSIVRHPLLAPNLHKTHTYTHTQMHMNMLEQFEEYFYRIF